MTCRKAFICFLLMAGFPVYAGPGDGIQIGDLALNPFVEGSYTFDSNIYLTQTNNIDDAFMEAIAGLQFHYQRQIFVLEGRLFGQFRRYQEELSKDFDDWGEKMVFRAGNRDMLYIIIDQSYRRVTDYDRATYFEGTLTHEARNMSLTYDRSTRVERDLFDIGLLFGRDFPDRLEMDFGIGTGWQDYRTNVLFDVEYVQMKAELGWRTTDKMSIVISADVTEEQNQSFDGTGRSTSIHLGVRRKTTDKMSLRIGAGMSSFSRPRGINEYGRDVQGLTGGARGVNEEPRLEEKAFTYQMSATLQATDKIAFQIAGHSGLQTVPQYPNTIDHISVGTMSAVYSYSDTVSVSLTGSYRRDDYLDPVVEQGREWIRLDERLAGLARLDYTPPREFMTVYVEGGYEQSESTIDHYNYDQLRLSAGLTLRY